MKYKTVPFERIVTNAYFADEVSGILNKQAENGWIFKQAMQLRANTFLFIFEKA